MQTKIATDRYIYPPRPQTTLPREELGFFKDLGFIAQIKYNGSRCLIKHMPDNSIQLWNRHGERFRTYNAPEWLQNEIRESIYKLGLKPDQYHVLDGELLDQKHAKIKDTIVIWDVLVRDSVHLLGSTYNERYASLRNALSSEERYLLDPQSYLPTALLATVALPENSDSTNSTPFDLGIKLAEHVLFADNYTNYDDVWALVDRINAPFPDRPLLEGVVLKDLGGTLERGFTEKNNHSWLVRSRVTTGRHLF